MADGSGLDRRDFFGGAGVAALTALGASLASARPALAADGDALDLAMEHMADVIRQFPAEFAALQAPPTRIDRAEGYRLFLRYLIMGIDQDVQFGDPAFPAFHQKTREGGMTIVPLQLYFLDGRAKVEIALAKGKKEYDKRQTLREKQDKREADRAISARKHIGE